MGKCLWLLKRRRFLNEERRGAWRIGKDDGKRVAKEGDRDVTSAFFIWKKSKTEMLQIWISTISPKTFLNLPPKISDNFCQSFTKKFPANACKLKTICYRFPINQFSLKESEGEMTK